MCGFFLRANNREREREREREKRENWKMKKEGNEKEKWHLGQNNKGIHWTRRGQLKGLLRWSKPPL